MRSVSGSAMAALVCIVLQARIRVCAQPEDVHAAGRSIGSLEEQEFEVEHSFCDESCKEKPFLYLVHGRGCLSDLSTFQTANSDVLQIVSEDPELECSQAIIGRTDSRPAARNALYAEALKNRCINCYLFLVFIDTTADLQMTSDRSLANPWQVFQSHLLEWEPAVAQPLFDDSAGDEVEVPIRVHQAIVAVHREASAVLLPYMSVEEDIDTEAVFGLTALTTYGAHVLQFNALSVRQSHGDVCLSAADASKKVARWLAGFLRRADDFLDLHPIFHSCGAQKPEPEKRHRDAEALYFRESNDAMFDACFDLKTRRCSLALVVHPPGWAGCVGPEHPDCEPSPYNFRGKLYRFLQEFVREFLLLEGSAGTMQATGRSEAQTPQVSLQISFPCEGQALEQGGEQGLHGVVVGLPVIIPPEYAVVLSNADSGSRLLPPMLLHPHRNPQDLVLAPSSVGVREFKVPASMLEAMPPGEYAVRAELMVGMNSVPKTYYAWCSKALKAFFWPTLDSQRCRPMFSVVDHDLRPFDEAGVSRSVNFRIKPRSEEARPQSGVAGAGAREAATEEGAADFLYLVQSDECLALADLRSPRSRVLQLVWKSPPGSDCRDTIYFPDSTLVQGRNRLFLEASTRFPTHNFTYYIIMDGDVTLVEVAEFGRNTGRAWRTFEEYLLAWEPAVGFPHFGGTDYDAALEVQLAYNFDQILVAYHREALPLLLPYEERFDRVSWWYCGAVQNALIAAVYNEHRIQFNALRALSWQSNPSSTYKRASNFGHPLAWIAPAIRSLDAVMTIPFFSPHSQATAHTWDADTRSLTSTGRPRRKEKTYVLGREAEAVLDFCHEYFEGRVLHSLCTPKHQDELQAEDAGVVELLLELQVRLAVLRERFVRDDDDDMLSAATEALAHKLARFECALETLRE